jgi:hypothetical protein
MRSFDGNGGHTLDPALVIFSDLKYIGGGYGYWIKVDADDTLTVTGLQTPHNASIPLKAGWNLITNWTTTVYHEAGFNTAAPPCNLPAGVAFSQVADIGDVFAALGTNLKGIRTFDCTGGKSYDPELKLFSDLTYIAPGYGIWVKVENDVAAFTWPTGD